MNASRHTASGGLEVETPNLLLFQPISMEWTRDVNLTEDNFGNTRTSRGAAYGFDNSNETVMKNIIFTDIEDIPRNPVWMTGVP
jgi:hypothetical protein